VPAATQQVAEPGAPADSGDQRRQQQVGLCVFAFDSCNISSAVSQQIALAVRGDARLPRRC